MRVRVVVHGRVQGVGYRYFTLQQAQKLGLAGWVKNQPNGTVLLEAQGSNETIQKLLEKCRKGPSLAYVSDMSIQEIPEIPGDSGFEVRY